MDAMTDQDMIREATLLQDRSSEERTAASSMAYVIGS